MILFLFTPPVRIWDIRPFAPPERQLKLLEGAQHGFEKVSYYMCVYHKVCVSTVYVHDVNMKTALQCDDVEIGHLLCNQPINYEKDLSPALDHPLIHYKQWVKVVNPS